ncbi:MAG: glycosyltransferase family 2 protein [Ignavibacteria bacterium]|nr:glycosyltransferase family 2 protein [Ignavibacteria bacterium]
MKKVLKLSIVIVTWNNEEEIAECLRSIYANEENEPLGRIETIIVDNASSDNTVKVVKSFIELIEDDVKIIANDENLGFTRGANLGLRKAKGRYIFLLNPDTEIISDALVELVIKLENEKQAGIIAPQLLFRESEIQKSVRCFPKYRDIFFEILLLSKLFPNSRLFSRWKMNYFSHNEEAEVEQPMGAALMFNRKILEEADYLDERYDMFYSDVDVCKKISLAGHKIIFFPKAKIKHRKGVSVYKNRAYMISLWNKDCLKYFKKFHYNIILYPLLYAGLMISGFFRKFFSN